MRGGKRVVGGGRGRGAREEDGVGLRSRGGFGVRANMSGVRVRGGGGQSVSVAGHGGGAGVRGQTGGRGVVGVLGRRGPGAGLPQTGVVVGAQQKSAFDVGWGDESAGDFGQAAVGVRVAVLLANDLSGGAVKVAARGKPFAPRGGHVRSPGFVHIPEDETNPSAGPVEDLAFDTSKVVDGGDVASVVEEYPDVLQDSGHRGCIS